MADIQFKIGNTELTNLIVQEQVRKEKLRLAAGDEDEDADGNVDGRTPEPRRRQGHAR